MSVTFKNDSDRLKNEFSALEEKNSSLFNLINDLSDFVQESLKKDLVITMIFRTDAEQADIYKNSPKYQAKPFKSPHQFWDAVDLRSSIFTPEEIPEVLNYLNNKYIDTNYFSPTAFYHEVDELGYHFHVQYTPKK